MADKLVPPMHVAFPGKQDNRQWSTFVVSNTSSGRPASWITQEIWATVGVIGTALHVFANLDSFIKFCSWLRPIFEAWRAVTRTFWDSIFFVLPVGLGPYTKDAATLWLALLAIIMSVSVQVDRSHTVTSEPGRTLGDRLVAIPIGSITCLLLQPMIYHFGSGKAVAMTDFLVVKQAYTGHFAAYTIGLSSIVSVAIVIMMFWRIFVEPLAFHIFANRMWRIAGLICALTLVNAVGIYADSIRAASGIPQ